MEAQASFDPGATKAQTKLIKLLRTPKRDSTPIGLVSQVPWSRSLRRYDVLDVIAPANRLADLAGVRTNCSTAACMFSLSAPKHRHVYYLRLQQGFGQSVVSVCRHLSFPSLINTVPCWRQTERPVESAVRLISGAIRGSGRRLDDRSPAPCVRLCRSSLPQY